MNNNIQTQLANIRSFRLQLEDAPAFGTGPMPAKDELLFVMVAHFFPLIIWPWKRSASPAVDAHGKEALNMAITILLIIFPLSIVSGLLGSAGLAMIISIGTSVLSLAMLMLVMIGAIKAQQGWLLRYPGNLRLIK